MKQYALSERAHFMCPQMHFGIVMETPLPYRADKLQNTLRELSEAHSFLRAKMAWDGARLYYDVGSDCAVSLTVRDSADTLWSDYSAVGSAGWNVFTEGLLKLFVYPEDGKMTVMMIAHHLLTDGRGLASLALEFIDAYADDRRPEPAPEHLIEGLSELPAGSKLRGMSRFLVRQANRKWRKEDRAVPYDAYLAFERSYCAAHPQKYTCYTMTREELKQVHSTCGEHGVTVTDWLTAQMLLQTGADKILIAADIRKLLPAYRAGSLGNYATAFSILCRPGTKDVMEKAREVHEKIASVQKDPRQLMLVLSCYLEMEPGLLDAAAISALGGFESKTAKFVGSAMFGFGGSGSYSLTNLGKFEDRNLCSLLFIPPASPAAKLTLGVVTLNGTPRGCTCEKA